MESHATGSRLENRVRDARCTHGGRENGGGPAVGSRESPWVRARLLCSAVSGLNKRNGVANRGNVSRQGSSHRDQQEQQRLRPPLQYGLGLPGGRAER